MQITIEMIRLKIPVHVWGAAGQYKDSIILPAGKIKGLLFYKNKYFYIELVENGKLRSYPVSFLSWGFFNVKYVFDFKSYLTAVIMILFLCLPFFYLGGLEWYDCFTPAMAIYVFLSFIHKQKQ